MKIKIVIFEYLFLFGKNYKFVFIIFNKKCLTNEFSFHNYSNFSRIIVGTKFSTKTNTLSCDENVKIHEDDFESL